MTSRKSNFDKIICVGKNYLDHALEMGDGVPEQPVFFFKPPSCLVEHKKTFALPRNLGSVHHELEIVYRITKHNGTWGFSHVTLGLDLTLRDLQSELKKKSLPWERAKAFPQSAVIAPWLEIFEGHRELSFSLLVNGELRQTGLGRAMRRTPEELITRAADAFTLCEGDLFFTGTPKGVGALSAGDHLQLQWGAHLNFEIIAT
jgi:2-keto-4-pentenoate hydratase/2-oxohepta-3-ene-1,7-dioic acid hydratase in catechol pathway